MLNEILVLGLASGLLSTTITKGEIFDGPREWVEARSGFFGKLLTCSFCFGHWAAALITGVYLAHLQRLGVARDFEFIWIVWWLGVTGVSVLVSGAISKLYEG